MTDETSHKAVSITARELASWRPLKGSADNDLLPELNTIVARSRDLARNHGVASGAIQTLTDNIVGVGLRLSAKPDYKLLGKSKDLEGVLEADSDQKAPLTPEKVEELFSNFWLIAENFRQQYCGVQELLEAEKNAFTPAPNGTSVTEETTAEDVETEESTVLSTSADTPKQP